MAGPESTTSSLDGPPERWKPALLQIVEEKLSLCRRLDALSKGQRSLIERGDADGLLALLAERQDLLGRLRALQEAMAPYRARWESLMGSLPAEEANAIRQRIDALAQLVRDILQRDDSDRRALDARRSAVMESLKSLGAGKNAVAAYSGAAANSPPIYHDDRG